MDDFRIFVSEHFFRTIFLFLESHRSSKHLLHDVNKLNRYSFIFFVYRSWIFITSIVLFSNLFSFQVYINHPVESFPIKSYHRLEKLRPYRRTTRKTRWIRVNQTSNMGRAERRLSMFPLAKVYTGFCIYFVKERTRSYRENRLDGTF